jgi:ferredoxin-type protein NapH
MKPPSIKIYRRTLQIAVALTFVVLPYLNRQRINFLYGNFLSFNAAGLPLADPLAVLQIALKSTQVSGDLVIGAGIVLILAACLGTVFCSWVCPFGLLSEWVHTLSQRMLPKKYRGIHGGIGGFFLKSLIFLACFSGFLFFAEAPVLNQLSMPGWYSRIFQMLAGQRYLSLAAVFVAGILLAEFATRNRLWCRYVCPQAYLPVLAKLTNPFRLKVGWRQAKCACGAAQSPCREVCSLALNPKTLEHYPEAECTNCGDCVVACKRMGGALEFRFDRQRDR